MELGSIRELRARVIISPDGTENQRQEKSGQAGLFVKCKGVLLVVITGPTGVGKTWLACALAQKACRDGYTVRYVRLPKLLQDLNLALADGRYPKLMTALAKTDLLLLDDWGLSPLTEGQRRDLLEIVEDSHNLKNTMITSQMPVEHWHELIGDPTLVDAILDRLIHSAHRAPLKGESLRKKEGKLAKSEHKS